MTAGVTIVEPFKPFDILFTLKGNKTFCFLEAPENSDESYLLLDGSGEEVEFSQKEFDSKGFIKVGQCYSEENYTALLLLDDNYWNSSTDYLVDHFLDTLSVVDPILDESLFSLIYDNLWLYHKDILNRLVEVLTRLQDENADCKDDPYINKMLDRAGMFLSLLNKEKK